MSLDSLPCVSIIVLNYNGKRYLDDCLNSLAQISYPKNRLEVIMVDNSSSDDSVDYVRNMYPWVRVAPLSKNYGFTGGNNLGADIARGEYLVFLNNDVVVDVEWLKALVNVVLTHPRAIVTSKSLFLNQPGLIDHVGSKATFIGRSFCINFGRKDDKSDETPRFVVQPYGASMLVKREVFEAVGRFDEDYFTSLEDTDIGLRAWLFGFEVIYVPTSVFYHVGGGTGGWGSRISDTMVYHLTKNSYMNILKCYDKRHAALGLMLLPLYYALTTILSIKERSKAEAKVILRAHVWIIKNFRSIISKRYDVEKNRRKPYSVVFNPLFFATIPEMINEYFHIQKFYGTYYAKTK